MNRNSFLIWALLALTLSLTSCNKDDDFISDFDNIADNIDGNEDSDDGHGHDHSNDGEGALTLYRVDGDNINKTKDYNVPNNLQSYQQDYSRHIKMWEYVTKLFPIQDRTMVAEFEVFHGNNEVLGYVMPVQDGDLSRWRLGLAIEVVTDLEKIDLNADFAYTIIHEMAHILTLNHLQLNADISEAACNTFHIGEGCANANSYLYEIYNLGWTDIIGEHRAINDDVAAQQFYEKYKDRFVTDYASTNPAEDIAEVFSVFVVSDNPPTGNTIADQKINAMYGRPELVSLRNTIRQQAIVRAMIPGQWKHSKRKPTKSNIFF